MNLASVLLEHARTHPNAAALLDPWGGRTRTTTFGELEDLGQRAAALLLRK